MSIQLSRHKNERLNKRARKEGSASPRKKQRSIFFDEEGITSAGMAVSILVCLTLVFSSAQIYRISSSSAEIQEVADAAALAAENEIAEYTLTVKLCDATVLSLTLFASTVVGIGIITACIPPLSALSEQLLSLGSKIVHARDKFAESACKGLNELQKVLPFLAAADAFCVARANNDGAMPANYIALGILIPAKGKDVSIAPDGLSEINQEAQENSDEIRAKSQEAEDAAEKANAAKQEAFMADCGAAPGKCQYERAAHLSGLNGSANPKYDNVDAWSFSVALERAKAYYQTRLSESEPTGSVKDKASYYLRMRFYKYVSSVMSTGYAHENDAKVELYFPKIFRNTREFKATHLYTERSYAVSLSGEGGKAIMHAYPGCPSATSIAGYGSVKQLDEGEFAGCETCGFNVNSMGNIASASTNVATGFEHHYEIIRQASEKYQSAMNELEPLKSDVQNKVSSIFDKLSNLLSGIGGTRLEANPPGRAGCVAMVVNLAQNSADDGFENTFLSDNLTLGKRAAVSGATLLEDTSDDESSIITSALDNFSQDGGAVLGAGRIVLDLWSSMLKAYEKGQAALTDALENGLGSISLGSLAGLGKWAAGQFEGFVNSVGLQPANLNAQKAVILNTSYITKADSGTFSTTFSRVKGYALSASSPTNDVFTGAVNSIADDFIKEINDSEFTIATIEFPVGGVTIPITITLPDSAKEAAGGVINSARSKLSDVIAQAIGIRQWQ